VSVSCGGLARDHRQPDRAGPGRAGGCGVHRRPATAEGHLRAHLLPAGGGEHLLLWTRQCARRAARCGAARRARESRRERARARCGRPAAVCSAVDLMQSAATAAVDRCRTPSVLLLCSRLEFLRLRRRRRRLVPRSF